MKIIKGQIFYNQTDLARDLEVSRTKVKNHIQRGDFDAPKHKLDQTTEKGKHKKRAHWSESEYNLILKVVRGFVERKQEAK